MARQLSLPLRTWGGRRRGAGRKRTLPGRPRVAHRARPEHRRTHPVHVTLRANRRVPSLRWFIHVACAAIRRASRDAFRIIEFSIQANHVHLLVEADDKRALSRGVQGLAIRLARVVNGCLGRRGRVWDDRWHGRALGSPREVRNALVYILRNAKKHVHAVSNNVDHCSSAPWFQGFLYEGRVGDGVGDARPPPDPGPSPVRGARTWLGLHGWRRFGLIAATEGPRCA